MILDGAVYRECVTTLSARYVFSRAFALPKKQGHDENAQQKSMPSDRQEK